MKTNKKSNLRKQNIFNTTTALIKFILFWVFVISQLPILLFVKTGSMRYMKFFMGVSAAFAGLRVKTNGKLVKNRPLMVVSNHISVFEFMAFPVGLGGSFFGKKDIESFPIVGWIAKKIGVVFVDRRPSAALTVLKQVQDTMKTVDYPMYLFPEGTTTNGAYVKEFKSSLFNFVVDSDITIQPVVLNYRYKNGDKINDVDMANHFAYFDNAKQTFGPKCERERSAFGQFFHIMMLGGFMAEITALPPVDIKGLDRKDIALKLEKIISTEYEKLK